MRFIHEQVFKYLCGELSNEKGQLLAAPKSKRKLLEFLQSRQFLRLLLRLLELDLFRTKLARKEKTDLLATVSRRFLPSLGIPYWNAKSQLQSYLPLFPTSFGRCKIIIFCRYTRFAAVDVHNVKTYTSYVPLKRLLALVHPLLQDVTFKWQELTFSFILKEKRHGNTCINAIHPYVS